MNDDIKLPTVIGMKQLLILLALEELGGEATGHDIALLLDMDITSIHKTISVAMTRTGLIEKIKNKEEKKKVVRFKLTEKGRKYLELLREIICVNQQS